MNNSVQLKYVIIFLFFTFFISCEEIVDVELNSTDKVLVAEAVIEPGEPVWLRLSYTSDYFSDEDTEYYSESIALITDDKGKSEKLEYEGEGLYRGNKIIGTLNTTYTLHFTEGENSYKASSTLFTPVEIKDVFFEKANIQTLQENKTAYYSHVIYSNNPNHENYYLFEYYTNKELQKDWYALAKSSYYPDDSLLDYKAIRVYFDKGDQVQVVVYTIDEASYNYYSQLNDIIGGTLESSSTPYNPKSNFGEGILGHFQAWSYDTFKAVVK